MPRFEPSPRSPRATPGVEGRLSSDLLRFAVCFIASTYVFFSAQTSKRVSSTCILDLDVEPRFIGQAQLWEVGAVGKWLGNLHDCPRSGLRHGVAHDGLKSATDEDSGIPFRKFETNSSKTPYARVVFCACPAPFQGSLMYIEIA